MKITWEEYDAVIFDMDGVLIDSEPFWMEAEKAVFKALGVELTEEEILENVGLKNNEVVHKLCTKHNLLNVLQSTVTNSIEDAVVSCIETRGKEIEGLNQMIQLVLGNNKKIAVATSSSSKIMNTVLSKLKLFDTFTVRCSAFNESHGKPHPAVFLSAAEKLKVLPSRCLVIEDSINGIIAAKAAGMKVIGLLTEENYAKPKFQIADWNIKGYSAIL
jgi:mannitol-1-/sugar-/sorbitol-6-/2-deoxyglucose-6-phosphatase